LCMFGTFVDVYLVRRSLWSGLSLARMSYSRLPSVSFPDKSGWVPLPMNRDRNDTVFLVNRGNEAGRFVGKSLQEIEFESKRLASFPLIPMETVSSRTSKS